jgi:hypothetical protein
MNQKSLHLYALPVVMVSVSAFLIVTTLSFRSGILGSSTQPVPISAASSALTTNLFKIKTYKNGLASIYLSQTTNPKASLTSRLSVGKSVGSAIAFNLAINQAATDLHSKL